MKILVSACLLGENCKYNGGNNRNDQVVEYLKDKQILPVCPEILCGMPTPRPCAELVNGRMMDENGKDVHEEYARAVDTAMKALEGEKISMAIVQTRSPTCGGRVIYDGTFTGTQTEGQGLFAKALREKGIFVLDALDIREYIRKEEHCSLEQELRE